MNVVILQPSYIPWRGYFDQIDVPTCLCSMMMCNTIDVAGVTETRSRRSREKQWLTIPVFSRGAQTENIPINQIQIVWDEPWNRNHFMALRHSYAKAPYFQQYAPLLDEIYQRHDEYLADFTIETSIILARALGFT